MSSIDDIPVAFTPADGWSTWPGPILAGCAEPRPDGAPDIDGYWRTIEVKADGQVQPDHHNLGHIQRIEQRGDRLVVTAGRVIHDMRCDGTLERGVHDVAEFDLKTEVHVVATYEDGVHVLRPDGMPGIEIRRHRDGDLLIWDYLGFTACLEHLAPSATHPPAVPTIAALGA